MNGKVYPGITSSILLCLLFLVIQIGLASLISVLSSALNLSGASLFIGVLTALTAMIAFAVVLPIGFKQSKRRFNEVFKFNKISPFLWISVILSMLGFVVITSELDNVLNAVLPMPAQSGGGLGTLLPEQLFVGAIIVMAIIPAFTEESFFRGLVLDGFNRNSGQRKAILLSALFFGIIHLNPWQFFDGFITGLFFAWVCLNANSIWPSIYMHFFNNALYATTIRYKGLIPIRGFNSNNAASVVFQPLWFDIMGLLLFVLGILLLKKGFDEKAKDGA
jgi:membrane protease YdiL (CAAX protease family)